MSYLEEALAEDQIDPGLVAAIIAPAFWLWYERHKKDRVKAKLWIFRPSVKIEALRPFFVALFGEPT